MSACSSSNSETCHRTRVAGPDNDLPNKRFNLTHLGSRTMTRNRRAAEALNVSLNSLTVDGRRNRSVRFVVRYKEVPE